MLILNSAYVPTWLSGSSRYDPMGVHMSYRDGQTFLIISEPNTQKLRNLRQNPHVMLALDGTGNLGDDVVVVEGTAELLNETSLSIVWAYPAFAEKFDGWLRLAHEAGLVNKDRDAQAMFADYSQVIRVTPTRFLVGVEMQSVSP